MSYHGVGLAQKKLVALLHEFDFFCEKHSLRYWCVKQTLESALQNKGTFIKDYEISVGILKEDCDVLFQYQHELPSTMALFTNESDGFSRIRDLYSSYATNNGIDHSGLKITLYPYSIVGDSIYAAFPSGKNSSCDSICAAFPSGGNSSCDSIYDAFSSGENSSYDSIFPLQRAQFDTISVNLPHTELNVSETSSYTGDIDPMNASLHSINTYSHLYTVKT